MMLLLQKQRKPLAVMQGLRPMFLPRCRPVPKQASACRSRRRNSLRSSGLHHSKENLKNMRYHSLSFWYSLHCFVLLPRRLGYKEYLRISSDILLSRKLGYKKYFKIFSDILYTRACEVGGKKHLSCVSRFYLFLLLIPL